MSDWEDDEWEPELPKKKADWDDEEDEDEDDKPLPKAPASKTAPPSSPAKKDAPSAKAKAKAEPAAKKEAASSSAEKQEAPKEEPGVNTKTITKNSMEDLEIKLQQHVDKLVKMVVPKLSDATATQACAKFVTDALNGCQAELTLENTETLLKHVKDAHAKRKKADLQAQKEKEAEAEAKKKEDRAKTEDAPIEDDAANAAFFADLM